ncbi:MAG TPA: zf-TFIIB domain-containing protein [Cryptosporangiaceae bacterium]|nr:zf-TFIIB domain-containing protein [Cryptosporangiaceae bacterium]
MSLICPKCQASMRQYERSGVTIDQCTECRGVFLDRGELERLADAEQEYHARQGAGAPPPAAAPPPPPPPAASYPTHHAPAYPPPPAYPTPSYGHGAYGTHGHRRRKHKGFLGEFFD